MPTKSGERKALIVGNSRYEYETPLALSGNDADLMERTLLKVGFSVSKFTNLTSDELKGAIRRFCAELSPSDTALVFYSGHSFNTGQMRLVPVDFDFKSGSMQAANEVETKTIPLASILSALSASGAKPKIVVIDGCRVKFPFTDPQQASPDAQISDTETLLCFATKPDAQALESAALHNSIYTRFLSEEILKPEKRSIEELFRAVTKKVYDATNGLQEPHIYGNLTEDFYFYEGPDEAVSVNTQATPQADNSAIKPVAQSLWNNLCAFMHWTIPKDSAELSTAVVINVTALLSLYLLLVLGIYVIAPSRFVALHEWIANAGIPFSENVSKILGPFLLSTPHCLNAVVGRYRQRARKLFDNAPEVKARPKWVPAPLLIGDQLVQDYQLSSDAPRRKPYVAGMEELQARLAQGDERWTISIEGAGGVGKSALAFEIARWASDSRPSYRLARFPLLPVFLRSLGSDPKKLKNVDEAAGDSLKYIMDVPKISAFLLQAILRKKRALVVVDGISEMPKEAVDALIYPEKGAADSRVLIVTSRSPTNLPDSLVIRPLALNLNFLDRVLDDLVAATVGSGRFSNDEREALRNRVRSLINERHVDGQQNEVPMIFLRLMIERADRLLTEKKDLDQLPKTLSELVTDYTEQLLRNEADPVLAIRQARIAAQVCMGKPRRPAARSENSYTAKGLPRELLDKFVIAGLMVQSGAKSDPFFKFTLDPIAEQLDANRLVIAVRDASADQAELDELVQQWEELPGDFIEALRRAAAGNFDSMPATQPALASKLWPGEVNPTGLDTTRSIDRRPAALTSTSLLAALEWDNHLGHQYQAVGNAIYTIGITFYGKNISDKPVQLQSVKIISGITGASADMVVETIDGSLDPSDSDPISPNALITLKTEFSGPTGLLAQEFINSWGLMYLSVAYDGEPHEQKITEKMTRKLYEAFRPYPLDPNPTAVQAIKWNKDGTVGKSTKLHGYYQLRKEYVEEPGVEEDRYRVYYQPGTHSFAADGNFILTCHMHGFKTLEEAQFASERDSAVVASHLGL